MRTRSLLAANGVDRAMTKLGEQAGSGETPEGARFVEIEDDRVPGVAGAHERHDTVGARRSVANTARVAADSKYGIVHVRIIHTTTDTQCAPPR